MGSIIDSTCIALVGLPGSGKSHLKKKSLAIYQNLKTLIPVTTRRPRNNELEGRDKYFISDEEFMKKMFAGDLFLVIDAYNQKSGFSKSNLSEHQCYISEFYYKDVKKLDNIFKQCIFILIKPSHIKMLKKFLLDRSGDKKETSVRISAVEDEMEYLKKMEQQDVFDFIFVNNYDKNSEDRFIGIMADICKKIKLDNRK